MKRKTTRRLSKSLRREQILRTALPIFAQYGPMGTTTKMLALAAGITEPVLYQHFASKEEIYRALDSFCLQFIGEACVKMEKQNSATDKFIHGLYFFVRTLILAPPGFGTPDDVRETQNITRLYLQSLNTDEAFLARANVKSLEILIQQLTQNYTQACQESSVAIPSNSIQEDLWLQFAMIFGVSSYWTPEPQLMPVHLERPLLVKKCCQLVLRSLGFKDDLAIRALDEIDDVNPNQQHLKQHQPNKHTI